jgi:hypothetical protein
VHIQEHTFQKADISVLKIFVLVLCIIQIFWDTEFWVNMSCKAWNISLLV